MMLEIGSSIKDVPLPTTAKMLGGKKKGIHP